jgi:hypothetical protein
LDYPKTISLAFLFLKKDPELTQEEVEHVLKISEQAGVLHPDEVQLALGYLGLQDTAIREVMRPKEEIDFLV